MGSSASLATWRARLHGGPTGWTPRADWGGVRAQYAPRNCRDERGGIAGARAHVWCDRVHAGDWRGRGMRRGRRTVVLKPGGPPPGGDNHLAGRGQHEHIRGRGYEPRGNGALRA